MQNLICQSLAEIGSKFLVNVLSYLSLTTKIELPFRDRFAFDLHQKLEGNNFIVSREWKRTDLAILNGNKPKALIEIKAMYTFDAALDIKNVSGYLNKVENDILKAKKLAIDSTEIYGLLLATHPEYVNKNYRGIIKYDSRINKAINKFGSQEEVKVIAKSSIENCFAHLNIIASGEIVAGTSFGCTSSVLYWLIKS